MRQLTFSATGFERYGKTTRRAAFLAEMWGDQAYRAQRGVIIRHTPLAKDFTNRRYRHKGVVDEKEWTKSKVRAKVEHAFFVIKRVFGFAKVRYRGLDKNAHRLSVACALANLFMARRHLLPAREA
jgi:IS5 family transposase